MSIRVHELAKELGVTSKEVLAKLNELGEYTKSASSTVQPPVARRVRDAFPAPAAGAAASSASAAPAKKTTKKAAAKPAAPAEAADQTPAADAVMAAPEIGRAHV